MHAGACACRACLSGVVCRGLDCGVCPWEREKGHHVCTDRIQEINNKDIRKKTNKIGWIEAIAWSFLRKCSYSTASAS